MNINTQELSILRKNMKFGEGQATTQISAPVTEPPVTRPEAGLNALEAQAQNNIAFQGVKLPTVMRQGMGKMMLMAALLAGTATMTTSCSDATEIQPTAPVTIINNITVDMSAWTKYMAELVEQQKITNQQMILMNQRMSELMELVKTGQMSADDFYKNMYEFMTTVITNQSKLEAQLAANGKTQEEIKEIMNEIKDLVEDDKYKEALNKIYNILLNMDGTLTDLLAEVKGLRDDINNNHKEYVAIKEEELKMLADLYNNGKINSEYLANIDKNTTNLEKYLANLDTNVNELKNIINDEDKYNKFIEDLKGITGVDYDKFEAMFKTLGLSIEDVVNMSRKDLLGAINEYQNNYLKTEKEQTAQLVEINGKLDILKTLPGLGSEELLNALADLKAGNADIVEVLKNIEKQIVKIQEKLDAMHADLGKFSVEYSKNNKVYVEKWDATLAKLDSIDKGVADLKAAKAESDKDLATLVKIQNEINNKLAEIDGLSNGGMTIEQFAKFMQERDAENFEKFKQYMVDSGYDQLPTDVTTIKDLLDKVAKDMQNKQDYAAQLDKIISLLEANPNYKEDLADIKKLIEEWKCDCQCGKDSTDTDESIKDLEDLFGKN